MQPGDLILYLGNQLTIYYNTNSWNFTKTGHINNISDSELRKLVGDGNVSAPFLID
ncbi:cyclophilin-like fold protein [Scardovia inopinata]|uniref:cyclophilin-like fold protein n=1 Tax=Scardovia inopinata TaxID=78259 RepID=UPI00031D5110|nr:conserved hypothetical protein [Scardovia inopinata JCM 12537]